MWSLPSFSQKIKEDIHRDPEDPLARTRGKMSFSQKMKEDIHRDPEDPLVRKRGKMSIRDPSAAAD